MILFQQVKCTERFTFLHKTRNKITLTGILHKIQITTFLFSINSTLDEIIERKNT